MFNIVSGVTTKSGIFDGGKWKLDSGNTIIRYDKPFKRGSVGLGISLSQGGDSYDQGGNDLSKGFDSSKPLDLFLFHFKVDGGNNREDVTTIKDFLKFVEKGVNVRLFNKNGYYVKDLKDITKALDIKYPYPFERSGGGTKTEFKVDVYLTRDESNISSTKSKILSAINGATPYKDTMKNGSSLLELTVQSDSYDTIEGVLKKTGFQFWIYN